MKKPTLLKTATCCLLFLYFNLQGFAQNNLSYLGSGVFETTSGNFQLTFQDVLNSTGTHFDDQTTYTDARLTGHNSNTLGNMYRWTVADAFAYIEDIIDITLPSGTKIKINIVSETNPSSNYIGTATPVFSPSQLQTRNVYSGDIHDLIVHGLDHTDGSAYEGIINFNFDFDFEPDGNIDHLSSTHSIDLYVVTLHEMIHAFGFFTEIAEDGSSMLSNPPNSTYSVYTDYDLFLKHENIPYLSNTSQVQKNPAILLPNILDDNATIFSDPDNSEDFPLWSNYYFGSSRLSHLDDARHTTGEFIMKPTYGYIKELSAQELEILCSIGYTIKGNASTAPYGCGYDKYTVGVDDGVTTPIYAPHGQYTLIDILHNDFDKDKPGTHIQRIDPNYGNNGFEVLSNNPGLIITELVSDANHNDVTYLKFKPNQDFCGTVWLRYRPLDEVTGRPGSVANVYIVVTDANNPTEPCVFCSDDICGLICNGSFERGIPLSAFERQLLGFEQDFENTHPIPTFVDGWWGFSCDMFMRGSSKLGNSYGIPENYATSNISGGVDTRTGANTDNDRYIRMLDYESIYTQTFGAIDPSSSYNFSFWSYIIENTGNNYGFDDVEYIIYVSENPIPGSGFSANYTGIPVLGTISPTTNNQWEKLSFNFDISSLPSSYHNKKLYIAIQHGISSTADHNQNTTEELLIDEVSLVENGPRLEITKVANPTNPAPGQTVTYTITVNNVGNGDATNVFLDDVLPSGMSPSSFNFGPYDINIDGQEIITYTSTVPLDAECNVIANLVNISADENVCYKKYASADIIVTDANGCNCIDPQPIQAYVQMDCDALNSLTLSSYTVPDCGSATVSWENLTTPSEDVSTYPYIASPFVNTVYRGTFTDANGCICGIIDVNIEILPKHSFPTKKIKLCGNESQPVSSPCPLTGATNQYISYMNGDVPYDADETMETTVYSNTSDLVMVTEYGNGCKCEYKVDIDGIRSESTPVVLNLEIGCGQTVSPFIFPYFINNSTIIGIGNVDESELYFEWADNGQTSYVTATGIYMQRNFSDVPGTYTADVYRNGCKISELIVNVTVTIDPANISIVNYNLCEGESKIIYPFVGQTDCVISPNDAYVSENGCIYTFTPPLGSSSYELFYKDVNGDCHKTTFNFNVTAIQTLYYDVEIECGTPVNLADYNVCLGSMDWYDGGDNPLYNNYVTPSTTTTYYGFDNVNCCRVELTVTVISGISYYRTYCFNEEEGLSISPGPCANQVLPGSAFTWELPDGSIVPATYPDGSIYISNPLPGVYRSIVTLDNGCECITEFIRVFSNYQTTEVNICGMEGYTIYPDPLCDGDGDYYEVYDDFTLVGTYANLSGGYYIDLSSITTPFQRLYCIKTYNEDGCKICDYCYTLKCSTNKRTLNTDKINNSKSQVNIYPNPSTGVFTLELTGYNLATTSYTIVDAVGREIMKTDNIANAKSIIDLSNYEKGIYFIRIQEGEAITTKKIIIQ